jgi:hypothetical protein
MARLFSCSDQAPLSHDGWANQEANFMRTLVTPFSGKFVSLGERRWGSFKNNDGETVDGGCKTLVTILTDNGDLMTCEANDDSLVKAFTFGNAVFGVAEARPKGGEIKLSLLEIRSAAKA